MAPHGLSARGVRRLRRRAAVVALLGGATLACFDEPVREHVHLVFTARGAVVVTVVQEVAGTDDVDPGNRRLAERLEAARSDLEHGDDPWSRRLAQLSPKAEHRSVERVDGELRRSIHTVGLESFEDVLRLLEADGLTGSLVSRPGFHELELFPTGGSRATPAQRREAERRLEGWSQSIFDYLTAADALYAHLNSNPGRAVPCLAHVLDEHAGLEEDGPLSPAEESLVRAVKEAMEQVVDALLVPDGADVSLNHLVRLVHDPLPARLTVAVEGALTEQEGWASRSGSLERPPLDAWTALRASTDRWLRPDLVTAAVALPLSGPQPELDVQALAEVPRWSLPPSSAAEVAAALDAELTPLERHWLRWRTFAEGAGPDSRSAGWLEILAAAEASLPD